MASSVVRTPCHAAPTANPWGAVLSLDGTIGGPSSVRVSFAVDPRACERRSEEKGNCSLPPPLQGKLHSEPH